MQLRSWVSPKEAPVLCMVCVLSSANKDPIIRHSCFIAHCPEPLAERTSVIAALKYRDVKTWQYQRVSASNSLGKSVERSDCQGEPKQEACIDLGYRSLPLISETRRQRSLSSPAVTWGSTCRQTAGPLGLSPRHHGDKTPRPRPQTNDA